MQGGEGNSQKEGERTIGQVEVEWVEDQRKRKKRREGWYKMGKKGKSTQNIKRTNKK